MKEGGYLLLEKENREIIIFDVLKFSLEENPYSNRIIGGDILIKLNSQHQKHLQLAIAQSLKQITSH